MFSPDLSLDLCCYDDYVIKAAEKFCDAVESSEF